MFAVFVRHRRRDAVAFTYYFLSHTHARRFWHSACNATFYASLRLLPDEEDPLALP